jgi:hypothetical protein
LITITVFRKGPMYFQIKWNRNCIGISSSRMPWTERIQRWLDWISEIKSHNNRLGKIIDLLLETSCLSKAPLQFFIISGRKKYRKTRKWSWWRGLRNNDWGYTNSSSRTWFPSFYCHRSFPRLKCQR